MVISFSDLHELRSRHPHKKIVLSSGTFDLFRVNHLYYLQEARKYGEIMVVMVSSDARVMASKGASRPMYSEMDRAAIIDGLKVVDYVFIEPGKNKRGEIDQTYANVFSSLKPDVFVTANEDWQNFTQVVGETQLIIIPRITEGRHSSTTAIISHIENSSSH